MNQALTLGYSQDHRQHHPGHLRVLLAAAGRRFTIPAKAKKLLAEAGLCRTASTPASIYCDSSYANMAEVVAQQPRGRSASASSCGRSSAPLSSRATPTRSTQGHHPGRERRLRQRRDAARGLRRQGRRLRLRQLSRHRRAVSAAGRRARPREARGDPATRCSSSCTRRRSTRRSGSSAFINGVGPRVGESGFGLIPGFAYTAPYEDITIKA